MTAEVEHFTTFIETAKRGFVGAGKVATER
jgi:hypothetical protein